MHCILGGLVLTCIVLRLAEAHLVAEEYPSVPECGDTALRIRCAPVPSAYFSTYYKYVPWGLGSISNTRLPTSVLTCYA